MFMLAELRADARQQHRKAERFCHIVVGTRIKTQDLVSVRGLPRQHDHRTLVAIAAHQLAGLAAVHIRQVDVENHKISILGLECLHTICCSRNISNGKLIMERQLFLQRAPQHVVIVNQKNAFCCCHGRGCPLMKRHAIEPL
jgi:hypothetical protein